MGENVEIPPVGEQETLALVQQCIEGDNPAWHLFYAHCRRALFGPIRSFHLPPDQVAEIVPDFLCCLWANECRVLAAYRPQPPSRFDSWLRVCFRRFALRWIRTRRLPHWDASVDVEALLDARQSVPCEDPHLLLGVSRVFDQLPDRQRRILSLSILRVPYAEIESREGMKEGHVAVEVQRIRERLHDLLAAQVLDLDPFRSSPGGRSARRRQE
jgi:RNA polymerase sigma factor (sigma-70 family)